MSFNPRLPGGRRPRAITIFHCALGFNPRLPGGRRPDTPVQPFPICRFNPRLPGGRRPATARPQTPTHGFQSTPSGGKATRAASTTRSINSVSIHAFRGEGDYSRTVGRPEPSRFNPRLPGGRRQVSDPPVQRSQYVSIHAFRGEGDPAPRDHVCYYIVSIHAFRGEGDPHVQTTAPCITRFNPRLPGGRRRLRSAFWLPVLRFNPRLPGGRRRFGRLGTEEIDVFQSTPSGGKATWHRPEFSTSRPVSIHAFRGEGDGVQYAKQQHPEVSIHAFRGEGDRLYALDAETGQEFQSTPSGGKATATQTPFANPFEFQSTPSGGKATLDNLVFPQIPARFNPRLPGGRRLAGGRVSVMTRYVSIHAFRGEGDMERASTSWIDLCFNPRLPGGRRRENVTLPSGRECVSIHAFRGEGDNRRGCHNTLYKCFNPRLPGGRRLSILCCDTPPITFQSTPSGGKATCAVEAASHRRRRFNPRLPGGRRPRNTDRRGAGMGVSIHAFRGEGDWRFRARRLQRWRRFNPRLPGGRRHQCCHNTL